MSLLLVEGFDDGLDRRGRCSQSTITVGSGYKRTGGQGARLQGGYGVYDWYVDSGDEHTTIVFGMAMRCTGIISYTNREVVQFYSDGGITLQAEIQPQPNGSFRITRGNSTTVLTTDTGLYAVDGTYHYLELKLTIDDATGAAEVHWDGVSVGSVSSTDTRNGGTTGKIDRVRIYCDYTTFFYVDDVYVCNGAGTLNNDFLGDCRVYTLFPNGNGNYSQLTGSDGNSTDNYLLVDEGPTPSSTDYVGDSTAGNKDTYTFDDLTPTVGTILGVATGLYAAKSDAGTKHARPVIRRSSTDAAGTDATLSISYTALDEIFEEDPVASAAWTVSTVNASEFGFEVRA